MFFKPSQKNGALAFITENEDIYKEKPIKSSNPFVGIIRTLTDLSFKIVACISGDIYEKWYFENKGKTNPYLGKIHQNESIIIKEIIVKDYNSEEINIEYEGDEKLNYYFSKDNFDLLFNLNYQELIEKEKLELRKSIKIALESYENINDLNILRKTVSILTAKIKLSSFKAANVILLLENSYENLISEKLKSYEKFCQKIIEYIEKEYSFTSYTNEENLESKIQKLLDPNKLNSKKIFKELEEVIFIRLMPRFRSKLWQIVKIKYPEEMKFESEEYFEKLIIEILNDFKTIDLIKFNDSEIKIKEIAKNFSQEKTKSQNALTDSIILKLVDQTLALGKIKKFVKNYLNEISLLKQKFKNFYISKIGEIEKITLGVQLNLGKVYYKVGEKSDGQLVLKIDKCTKVFSYLIPTKNFIVSQIISLELNVIFILISNTEKNKTHVLRFNPKLISREDYEICDDINDSKVFIAWGSSSHYYFMFQNTNKLASHSSLKNNKYFGKGRNIEDIYSKITEVKSSFYLRKSKKLFIIDESGFIYSKDFNNEYNNIYLVKANNRANEISQELEPLKPNNGSKFLDINVSEDENNILLLTESNIECYDVNFKLTHSIPILEKFSSYKYLTSENECFLLIQNTDRNLKCIKLTFPRHDSQIKINKHNDRKIIEGNPIFDIHHLGIIKFGPLVEETQKIKGERCLWHYILNKDSKNINLYLQNLKEVKKSFKIETIVNPSKLFDNIVDIKKSEFIFSISVSIPLHIAAIQNGNLIPLHNGINNFDEFTNEIEKNINLDVLINYIRFGNYEEVIENLKDMLIISIMGRQSSGKSYLLNRLVGTRFDVSAERCTEGLWMGIGCIENTPVVVFDCEGLFTIERSTQEEIKICLFISSLSDVIILNTHISSGKHIKELFDGFASGSDRLRGKNLFKGYLDMTFRDIPDSQDDETDKEIENFVKILNKTGNQSILSKLFKQIFKTSYHNFESSSFDDEIDQKRNEYLNLVEKKWPSETKICLIMKIILIQIFSDDNSILDEKMFNVQIRKLNEIIDNIISNPEFAKTQLKNEIFKYVIDPGPNQTEFNLVINEFYYNEKDPLKYFLDSIKQNIRRKNHNSWYNELENLIKTFFGERKILITNFFKENLPKGEFLNKIEYEVASVEKKLYKIEDIFSLCLRKCEKCDFVCIMLKNHICSCNCGTDHICIENCSYCSSNQRCHLPNGHKSKHFCKKPNHKCIYKCSVEKCHNFCTFDVDHNDDIKCRCSCIHPCGKNCRMHDKCGQNCEIDINSPHEIHTCGGECPFLCFFNDGNKCSSTNHFHDEEIGNDENKKHLCGSQHTCESECRHKGVCEVKKMLVEKVYKNMYNEFRYINVELKEERLKCKEIILQGQIFHKKKRHICESKIHTCEHRCPDCNCFCELIYNHTGYHSSSIHRNKDCSEYISTDKIFSTEFQNESLKTAVTYIAGDSAAPEICDLYCQRKNRGHTHPILCKKNDLCMEITHKGFAMHSNENFNSATDKAGPYDFVTCETYWKYLGWLPPNEKDAILQDNFGKCNFICEHFSHKENGEKVFCEGNLFHSMSSNYCDHDFKCTHKTFSNFDIVFILDCTFSMNFTFLEVRKVIHNIMDRWRNESNKFIIVGYTDHFPDNGHMPKDNPVSVYPTSKRLEDGHATQVADYMDTIRAMGGGTENGEALLDGLSEANKLEFRNNTGRIYILICDDSPHGEEFNSDTKYPAGCPCNISWRDELRIMKSNNVNFIFVKLSEMLNKTVNLFSEVYGQSMRVMNLDNVSNLGVELTHSVNKTIETNFVFSKKLKK